MGQHVAAPQGIVCCEPTWKGEPTCIPCCTSAPLGVGHRTAEERARQHGPARRALPRFRATSEQQARAGVRIENFVLGRAVPARVLEGKGGCFRHS